MIVHTANRVHIKKALLRGPFAPFAVLRCAVTLPCYFLLAVPALGTSGTLASLSLGRGRRAASVSYGREYWRRLAVCAGVLALGLCVELLFGQRVLYLLLKRLLA